MYNSYIVRFFKSQHYVQLMHDKHSRYFSISLPQGLSFTFIPRQV